MVRVRVENIEKKFGEVTALHDLNFDVKDGEFFILLGASGSGKSTTLNILSGLDQPTTGNIYFDDEDVTKKGPFQRGVAMVFQDYALYPHMTVYKNMAFPLKMRGRSKSYIDSKVKETAEVLEITKLLDRKPRELSGGQAQRVALGRSLVRDPKLFLLDEPLSNLDTNIRSQIRTELKVIHHDLGKTFVYVTHDQQEALSLGDRIAILNKGKIDQLGAPSSVYNNPANHYISSFLGEPKINSFNISREDGGYNFEGRIVKEIPYDSESLIIAIRPEKLEIDKKDSKNNIQLPVEVKSVEDFGSYLVITGMSKTGNQVSVRTSDFKYRNATGTLETSIPIEECHFFDSETGEKLEEK